MTTKREALRQISNIRKNRMGTVSFDGKLDGMRKAQDFITYPIKDESDAKRVTIQSDTRIGIINLENGKVTLSPARSGGSYFVHLIYAKPAGVLNAEELLLYKAAIFGTAHGMAGSNGMVYTDNSGAVGVFAQ